LPQKGFTPFHKRIATGDTCSGVVGWDNGQPFSASAVESKNAIAIGYKDLGAGDETPPPQSDSQTPQTDPIVDPSQPQPQLPVVQDPIQPSNDGTGSGVGSGSEADSVLLATKTKTKTKASRSHIMLTCGGCMRTIECTELWTDLLIQSRIDTKTKNIRHLYALRGPDKCSGSFPEYNVPLVAQSIFDKLIADKATQLVVIPHSSGGGTCGKVMRAINGLDKEKQLDHQVTLLSLDAGSDSPIALKKIAPNFFREDGFFGYLAKDNEKPTVLSHLSDEAHAIATAGGKEKTIEGASGCVNDDKVPDHTWCEHFAVFCKDPPHVPWGQLVTGVDCPKVVDGAATNLESSFLDDIPF